MSLIRSAPSSSVHQLSSSAPSRSTHRLSSSVPTSSFHRLSSSALSRSIYRLSSSALSSSSHRLSTVSSSVPSSFFHQLSNFAPSSSFHRQSSSVSSSSFHRLSSSIPSRSIYRLSSFVPSRSIHQLSSSTLNGLSISSQASLGTKEQVQKGVRGGWKAFQLSRWSGGAQITKMGAWDDVKSRTLRAKMKESREKKKIYQKGALGLISSAEVKNPFDEVALIKDAKRIATVVCMEETELLVVDKKDFLGYHLDEELHREFLTRYNYLRKVEIFETLSNDSLEKIAHHCRIERFHFGQVITSDIGESSSITFVIKGACDVLRQIDLSSCPSYHKWLTKHLMFPKGKQQVKEKKRQNYVSDIVHVDRFKSAKWNSFSGQELSQLKARYVSQMFPNQDFGKQGSALSRPRKSVVMKVDNADESSSFLRLPDDDREVVQNVISGVVGKQSVHCSPYGEIPASAAAAVYIRVDELYKGDYLVNLEDNRPMILVSKGADLIRLKKDKLEECADDATIMKFGKIKVKYPSDDELCQVFLRQNSWEFFKKDLLQFVMKPKLTSMVTPPDLCPAKEIAGSWYMNEKGILDLTPLQCNQKLPPETCKYVPCHPTFEKEVVFLPEIQPRLIHGINVIRPSLDGVF